MDYAYNAVNLLWIIGIAGRAERRIERTGETVIVSNTEFRSMRHCQAKDGHDVNKVQRNYKRLKETLVEKI